MSKKLFDNMHTKQSYGQVSFSRITCSPSVSLYGSSARHSSYITLKVMRSHQSRDMHDTRHYTDDTIVEVNLSANQFSELITSLNMGSGIPCTIQRLEGKSIVHEEAEHERITFQREFEEQVAGYMDAATKLKSEAEKILTKKGSLSVADKKTLLALISGLQHEQSNLNFVATQFDKFVDKSVTEAKQELDAHVDHIVKETGLKVIKNESMLADTTNKTLKIERSPKGVE